MGRTVVAIDGPAASGKSTVARRLARRLGFVYLPSGAFYRALALRALESGTPLDDEAALAELAEGTDVELRLADGETRVLAEGRDVTEALGSSAVAEAASQVSVFPAVRRRMVSLQRAAARGRGVVAEGRDMASVVFPEAEHKFYLDASPQERARRRARELRERGEEADEAALAEELAGRDRRDSSRATAPLRQTPDAVRVDTTALGVEEVVRRLLGHVGAAG
ncbi:MAG: (d)CMP kinase [bacterium]